MSLNVDVSKKRIDTTPIKNLFIQGEALADTIELTLPLTYGSISLAELSYAIRVSSEDCQTVVSQTLTKRVGEVITLSWSVSDIFTAVPGKLSVELVGSKVEGTTIVKCDGSEIYCRPDPTTAAYGTATPSAYETLVAQVNAAIVAARPTFGINHETGYLTATYGD